MYAYRMSWYGRIIEVILTSILIKSIKDKPTRIALTIYYIIWYLFMFLLVNNGGTLDASIYRGIWMK